MGRIQKATVILINISTATTQNNAKITEILLLIFYVVTFRKYRNETQWTNPGDKKSRFINLKSIQPEKNKYHFLFDLLAAGVQKAANGGRIIRFEIVGCTLSEMPEGTPNGRSR